MLVGVIIRVRVCFELTLEQRRLNLDVCGMGSMKKSGCGPGLGASRSRWLDESVVIEAGGV